MSINQNNMTINQVFDEVFSFPENITPEQKKEIKNLFITSLIKSGKNISTLEKLKYELTELASKKATYLKQVSGITAKITFDEFKGNLNELLSKNDFSGLDEDFKPIDDILKQRDKKQINETISLFDKQRTQNYVDSNKKTSKFKFYVKEKVQRLKDLPSKDFKRNFKKVAAGVVAVAVLGSYGAVFNYGMNLEKNNQQNNVCVEYRVRSGDTNTSLNEMFYEYGYSYLEVSGAQRNLSSNKGNPFAGDVVIGRTTKEKADELVSKGKARIISIEEAIELLGENHSLIGEFKRASNQESNIVFYVPVNEKSLG